MTIWNEIKAIKSKTALANLTATLEAQYIADVTGKVSDRQIAHDLKTSRAYAETNHKKEGLAYYREICLSLANQIVHKASTRQHFNPPSTENLDWGGFLGGENLIWTDQDDLEVAEGKVVKILRAAQ